MKNIAEICCGSWADCVAAEKGGADRVELNSALALGGLTPSLGALALAKQKTKLKVIAMVRPRPAGFCYDEQETAEMLETTRLLLDQGADGLAFGFLTADKKIDLEKTAAMVELIHSYGKEAVFHRAFDCVSDPFEAARQLIDLHVDRVLTSGLRAKAYDGTELLKQLQERYGNQIEWLAGSGVNADNAADLIQKTGISQLHSSCKGWKVDPTTTGNEVSYRVGEDDRVDQVEEALVRRFVQAVKQA